jgi:pyruvate-ferredoxin/flavodoxin oxidoreductase
MVPLAEFIELDESNQQDLFPYIWAVDDKERLMRVLVSAELVNSTIERRDFWRQLKSLAGVDNVVDVAKIVQDAKVDMAQKITSSLLAMAAGSSAVDSDLGALLQQAGASGAVPAIAVTAAGAPADYEPVWIETPECTACDECTDLNPSIFAYNADKQAIVVNPRAGSFADIVKAAEKCTAEVIHPGTPFNPNEVNLDRLIQRAAKFQ